MRHESIGTRATGRNAAALKYDILTALGAHGCGGDKHLQRLTLRLITLIVARYNWMSDEISVGQREIAALWSIDERSVKREMAKLRELGWLVMKRPAARGRVALHGLGLEAILRQTEPDWPRIGSDFMTRLARPEAEVQKPAGNVIAFPAPESGAGLWPRIQAQLHRDDPHLYAAWFAALHAEIDETGALRLTAPTRFHADYLRTNFLHRLERMAVGFDPDIRRVILD